MRQGKMKIEGKSYDFNFGGTESGDMAAQKDVAQRVFKFLSKLKRIRFFLFLSGFFQ